MSRSKWPKDKNIGDIYTNPLGVKWKWNGKGWISLKESEVVYLTGPTGPAGATGSFTGSTSSVIFYQFSHGFMDPMDNSEYYIGNISDLPAQTGTSVPSRRVKFLVDGKVNKVSIMTQISGVLGTNENQQFKINNHTTGNFSQITPTYSTTGASMLDVYTLSNPLDVSNGDELEIIWNTPVFATAPTIVRHYINVYVEF